jgi:DNA invertase Pin-like site-specific DNA recombinase
MTRAAIYLRRSTDKQETSIADQECNVRKYAASQSWEIVSRYCDDAISGDEIEERVDFERMIQDAKSPAFPFEVILCYDQSRFGRFDSWKMSRYLDELRDFGVKVVFVADPLQQGMVGRLLSALHQEQHND